MPPKRPAAALRILLCALMLLPLTGCGRGVAKDHPDRTEFVSVAQLKIDAVSETASYSGPEYMDGTVCVYDSFAVDPNGSYSFNPYGSGATGVTTPMVIDLQTGEARELGISFPYFLEDGTWFNLDPYQELYWYRDGLWYLFLREETRNGKLYTFDETTGELERFVDLNGGVKSVLLTGDTLYVTIFQSETTLMEVDLNTGEVTELALLEQQELSSSYRMTLLECTEQTLYIKEQYSPSNRQQVGIFEVSSGDGIRFAFRILAVDRATGEVTEVTDWLSGRSVSNACGRLLCFVDLDRATVRTVDLVTGEICEAVNEQADTIVSEASACGRVIVTVNLRAYLYDPVSGESLPIPYCGYDIVRLIRETPSQVVFRARTEDGVDDWVADREAFAEGRMDETNTFRLTDR